ncbi:MAG TPA: hypothetical protein VFF30_02880 [Nitrososphaerales archaeon]|nr:hypothetical protein [Nitrososphaerales archaeon]
MGIFPADFGMNTTYLTIILVMGVAITAVASIALYWSTRHPDEVDKHSLAKYEKYWVAIILVIFIAFSISTFGMLPYPYAHANITPDMTVDVQAQQFAWCLSSPPNWGTSCQSAYKIPVGLNVLFRVNSSDVTHGFGVYDPAGAIVFQVQVMPGFVNSILYRFTTPGIYYIRCLEFCGYGHFAMIGQINVTSS